MEPGKLVKRALDLFCGAGGATRGMQLAGFHVTGVDLVESPRYVGDDFVCADATDFDVGGFDFVWASPPCQRYSVATAGLRRAGKEYPDLVAPIRALLEGGRGRWCIENVVGSPLRRDAVLCGRMFGLCLIRHRVLECSFPLSQAAHVAHDGDEIPVYGNGTPSWHRARGRRVVVAQQREAMGIDWMTRKELSQAIPPAYSRWVAEQAV